MKKYIAECFGTAVLVLFGCGSAVTANTLMGNNSAAEPLGYTTLLIAFAFGLSVVVMAYTIGDISGCHINPAISIGFFASGRMSAKDLIGYLAAQFIGGLAGAGLLALFMGSTAALGQNGYGEASALNTGMGMTFAVETVLTFVFVLLVLKITANSSYSSIAGLIIGLALTLIHILGIPFSGTSVNPARSFGPALLAGGQALMQVWLFLLAPALGGVLAALAFKASEKGKSA
ncbi:MAG: aquaporin [Lachnospiraceae bacterium]